MESVAAPAPKRRRRRTKLQRRQTRIAWLLLLPSLAVVALVALYPLGKTVYQSFTNQEFLALTPTQWVGLANYRQLIHDTVFRSAVWETIKFTLITVSFEFALGLAIALVVHSSFKGRGVMRAVMLVPWAIPTVVAAQMWKWMLDDTYGTINDLAMRAHLISHPHAWVADPSTSLASVCAVDIWKTTPFVALLLLAGLALVPEELLNAARVDGATGWQRFTGVLLPVLRPAILVALLFRTLDAFRVFDSIYVLTRGTHDTRSVSILGYDNLFKAFNLGLGSAISVLIFLSVAVIAFIYITIFGASAPGSDEERR